MIRPATRVTNTIRTLRFLNGEMTQQTLADRIGLTRQTVIAIEQGRYSPTLEAAFRIAAVFALPLEQVFHYSAAAGGHGPPASPARQFKPCSTRTAPSGV